MFYEYKKQLNYALKNLFYLATELILVHFILRLCTVNSALFYGYYSHCITTLTTAPTLHHHAHPSPHTASPRSPQTSHCITTLTTALTLHHHAHHTPHTASPRSLHPSHCITTLSTPLTLHHHGTTHAHHTHHTASLPSSPLLSFASCPPHFGRCVGRFSCHVARRRQDWSALCSWPHCIAGSTVQLAALCCWPHCAAMQRSNCAAMQWSHCAAMQLVSLCSYAAVSLSSYAAGLTMQL